VSAVLASVVEHPITTAECADLVAARDRGAVVTFAGVVRDHDGGRGVTRLAYTAHPSADDVIAEVAAAVAARHPETSVAVLHRIGALEIGDVALACAVSSAHRAAAFAACADLVDEVKARVPIWKEQHFADGSSEWVGALD
jgi:molybdopterin synthase catalytic subunit